MKTYNVIQEIDLLLAEYGLEYANPYKLELVNRLLGLNWQIEHLYTVRKRFSEEQIGKLKAAFKRLQENYPIQYLLQSAAFIELDLLVDERVLIPRPETEEVVYTCYELIKRHFPRQPVKLVDVGTGSGAIALGLAHLFQKYDLKAINITGIELSEDALAVARINHQKYPFNNVTFERGDLLEGLIKRAEKVEFIVANLPYVAVDAETSPNVAFEPETALFAGKDGLDCIRRLLDQAPQVLVEKGVIVLEIGFDQAEAVMQLAKKAFPTHAVRMEKDLYGQPRAIVIAPVLTKK